MGRVHKLMPGLNAAFIDVGYKKDAFLHYLDLGVNFNSQKIFSNKVSGEKKRIQLGKFRLLPEIPKNGTISDVLSPGQKVLVQIAKEPISTKGPRLTSELSIAGRFLVLMPFCERVFVSTKIKSSEERTRLKQLIQSVKPKNFGIIVRTVAEGKKVAELYSELKVLLKRWDNVVQHLMNNVAPSLALEETSRTVVILRDILNYSFEKIYVNDSKAYEEILNYVKLIMPEKADIVKLYDGKQPVFDKYGVTKQIKSSFGRTVSYRNGAYLIIEHTEALHVIDVNSGNRSKPNKGQEETALEVNLYAADEIARQLRLRDMGGIIVIDFIDMVEAKDRQLLFERMLSDMQHDRAKHNILPLTKFGLMQITRQRVRPQTYIETAETCPTCFGKGKIMPSILFTDMLERKIAYITNTLKVKNITLKVHPYVAAFVKQGYLKSLQWKWKRKYGMGLSVFAVQSLAYLQYQFFDKNGDEIDMKEDMEIR